jgi:hypothetical protein
MALMHCSTMPVIAAAHRTVVTRTLSLSLTRAVRLSLSLRDTQTHTHSHTHTETRCHWLPCERERHTMRGQRVLDRGQRVAVGHQRQRQEARVRHAAQPRGEHEPRGHGTRDRSRFDRPQRLPHAAMDIDHEAARVVRGQRTRAVQPQAIVGLLAVLPQLRPHGSRCCLRVYSDGSDGSRSVCERGRLCEWDCE